MLISNERQPALTLSTKNPHNFHEGVTVHRREVAVLYKTFQPRPPIPAWPHDSVVITHRPLLVLWFRFWFAQVAIVLHSIFFSSSIAVVSQSVGRSLLLNQLPMPPPSLFTQLDFIVQFVRGRKTVRILWIIGVERKLGTSPLSFWPEYSYYLVIALVSMFSIRKVTSSPCPDINSCHSNQPENYYVGYTCLALDSISWHKGVVESPSAESKLLNSPWSTHGLS